MLGVRHIVSDHEPAGHTRVGNSRQHLESHVRHSRHRGEVTHLLSHDPGRPGQPVQRQLIDDEPRQHVPPEQPPLPFHPRGQPGLHRLVTDARVGAQQRGGVVLGLQQAVDDSRRPRRQAAALSSSSDQSLNAAGTSDQPRSSS